MMSVLDLPTDIFLSIFYHLSVRDVLSLREVTCKEFWEITKQRSVWHLMLYKEVIQKNIPIRMSSLEGIDGLTATEMEDAVRNSLLARRNWTSELPVPSRRREIRGAPIARVVMLQFLPQKEHKYLLSLSARQREFILHCWDIQPDVPSCVAVRNFHDFRGIAINAAGSESDAILAIQSTALVILSLDLTGDPTRAFTVKAEFSEETGTLIGFDDTSMVTWDEHGRLYFWDTGQPRNKVELQTGDVTLQQERPLDIVIQSTVVMIFRFNALEIYRRPLPSQQGVLSPVAEYRWNWRLDSIAIAYQTGSALEVKQIKPINIVVRFGSPLPWPINLLHHYVLHPNRFYNHNENVSRNNLPYHPEPILHLTISSPVRLFAKYHMVVGSHGSAIWIDSHTEDYFRRSDRGQRLVGTILPAMAAADDAGRTSVDRRHVYSIYDTSEDDTWARLAVNEDEGRIAIGRVDGVITLLEYT